ncbi:MAG: HAD-IIIA family hydrolase [Oscillospiraceae bacterium]|jgi:3-deoxy-D-manno-octulosonate 8-phosphate phosphatase (KDO 8-P phosphatase)|nr:HAD-IIIA family hydrolase [Oscillospiraceae bacterium]
MKKIFDKQQNKNIKMLVMDVDGTLTDGRLYYGGDGEVLKAFHSRDGYGLIQCENFGIITAIITGRTSEIVLKRAKDLKINEVYQNVSNKIEVLKEIAFRHGIDMTQIAYIGDDLNDAECMSACGLAGCPADAHDDIAEICDYVCDANGGQGAVREFLDYILKEYNAG